MISLVRLWVLNLFLNSSSSAVIFPVADATSCSYFADRQKSDSKRLTLLPVDGGVTWKHAPQMAGRLAGRKAYMHCAHIVMIVIRWRRRIWSNWWGCRRYCLINDWGRPLSLIIKQGMCAESKESCQVGAGWRGLWPGRRACHRLVSRVRREKRVKLWWTGDTMKSLAEMMTVMKKCAHT